MDNVLPSRGSISIYTRARNTAGMMIKGNGPRLEASFELIHRDGFRLSSSTNFIDSFLSGNWFYSWTKHILPMTRSPSLVLLNLNNEPVNKK